MPTTAIGRNRDRLLLVDVDCVRNMAVRSILCLGRNSWQGLLLPLKPGVERLTDKLEGLLPVERVQELKPQRELGPRSILRVGPRMGHAIELESHG
jgi:hypothetical protein